MAFLVGAVVTFFLDLICDTSTTRLTDVRVFYVPLVSGVGIDLPAD